MDAKMLGDMVGNPTIADDIVFDALWQFLADTKSNHRAISDGELVEMDELREHLLARRPAVIERLRQEVVSQHGGCCDTDDCTPHEKS